MKAYYIRTIAGIDVWQVIGRGENFFTEFSTGHTKQEIEDYYND